MADGYVQVTPDHQGKKIDAEELTVGANTVQRQRIQIAGAGAAEIAGVKNSAPGATDYGSVVRPIPLPSTAGTPAGVTVSTSAVSLKASNANRRAIVITNNGVGNLYIGHTSGVTSSGANVGLIVPPFGSYTDSGDGLYTGDLYGIYDQASAVQNVSVSERT